MKICHYIASKGLGRGEAYIDVVNVLCNVPDKEIEIVLLVPKNALFIHRVDKSIKVVEYQQKDSRSNPFLYVELYNKLKDINPDIVHTHFAKASLIFSRLNRLLHLPHVATKHNPRKGKIYNKLSNVIAVSDAVKQSVKHNNVQVIYNGLIPEEISNDRIDNKVFTICSVGRLDKIKGYDILIRACSKLSMDYQLHLVGDGDELKALQDLINELGVQDKVSLLGFRTDIPQIMNQSDLIVVSSHSEGFSLATLESLYYGQVLISTKVGGAVEILPDNLLTDHAHLTDKIADVLNHYDKYKNEFSALQEKLRPRFLLGNIALEYIQYYENVLKE